MSKTGDAMIDELRELPENQGRVCGQCYFWRGGIPKMVGFAGNSMSGFCHRYPPRVTHDTTTFYQASVFPKVSDDEWCGEWKPVESLATTRLPTGIPE